jgi:hypothetical protein
MKSLYNSKQKKIYQFIKKISIAPIGAICSHLSQITVSYGVM